MNVGDAGRLFAVGAHCDDLAFSLGAAFWDGRLAGCTPVTVFSRSGYTLASPAGDAAQVTALRKAEDRRFFSRTAAAAPAWLDQLDAPLRSLPAAATVFTAPVREDELDALRRALMALLPPQAAVLAPLALGGHLDHRLVCGAACRMWQSGHRRIVFYEDLPYAGFMELESIDEAVARLSRALGCALLPELWPSASLATAKRWAITSYASQVDQDTVTALLRHAGRLQSAGVPAERVWFPADDQDEPGRKRWLE